VTRWSSFLRTVVLGATAKIYLDNKENVGISIVKKRLIVMSQVIHNNGVEHGNERRKC
jgi:hypothetical protein